MAEGGPSLDAPSVDSTSFSLSDSHLLECPICLEHLRQPKCLPCLHSLCQECLSNYIVKETSATNGTASFFTCPVCRKLTHPVDKSVDKEHWAKQFPTDSHAVEMIQLANQRTETLYCKPCQMKGSMTPAKFWCGHNRTFFCKSCKADYHDMVHAECDTVDISKSSWFHIRQQETSVRRCDEHHKKKNYYCEDHKFLGCSKCMTVSHRKCEDVSAIEDYNKKLETISRLHEMRNSQHQGADAIESLLKEIYEQLQSISDDKEAALKSIDDLNARINKRIEEMKKEITDDLISAYKEEREKLKVSSQKCERLKAAIQNTQESSARALQNKDHMNTILLYQRGEAEVESCQNLVAKMMKSFSTTKIEHEIQSNISNIGAVLSLGKVVVRKQQRNVPAGVTTFCKPLSRCEMKATKKVYIKCPSDTSDCVAYGVVNLPDGRIVVSDLNNRKLKLINCDGDVIHELTINGSPWNLCMVDNNTLAASTGTKNGICVVTVAPSKLVLSYEINTTKPCKSITHRDGGFVVNTESGVCSVSKDGMTHKLHGCNGVVYGMCHDHQHGQLFFTHYTDNIGKTAIDRLSDDNNQTEVLKVGIVQQAFGVDVDVEGNVYVCGTRSNNVVQMSGDGTSVRELLTIADGIVLPRAISVCGDKIVVTQRNYIQVFQLV